MRNKKNRPLLIADALVKNRVLEQRGEYVRTVARQLAEKLNAKMDLVHIESISKLKGPNLKLFFDRYLSEQEGKLRNHARSNGVAIRPLFIFGDPLSELLWLSKKPNRYELIGLATHGRKGLGRMILGSITEELVRNSSLPVLTVGPAYNPKKKTNSTKEKVKLIVGTDLGESSRPAEAYALDLAIRLKAEVILVHCLIESFHPVLQTALSTPHPPSELMPIYNSAKARAIRALERKRSLFKRRGVATSINLDEESDSASSAVLSEIDKSDAQFSVMGTHARKFLTGVILGRSVRRVILESPIPTITVK